MERFRLKTDLATPSAHLLEDFKKFAYASDHKEVEVLGSGQAFQWRGDPNDKDILERTMAREREEEPEDAQFKAMLQKMKAMEVEWRKDPQTALKMELEEDLERRFKAFWLERAKKEEEEEKGEGPVVGTMKAMGELKLD